MKTLEMNDYGVQEMNMQEMKEVDGPILLAIFLTLVIIGIIVTNNPV